MNALSLHAAFGTSVAAYEKPFAPVELAAQAMNAAVVEATNEAMKQLAETVLGREIRVLATSVTTHVGAGGATATCVVLYELVPVVVGVPPT